MCLLFADCISENRRNPVNMKVKYLKTIVRLLVLCAIAMEMKAQTSADSAYVDMNLPSGTLWKLVNESNEFYEYEELIKHCQWIWTGTGYLDLDRA